MDTGLNRAQLEACRRHDGVTLVLAGAGTGKTRTLIHKIITLIKEEGADPAGILVLTFSRKAAEEIRERIVTHAGGAAGRIVTGTFHSFCLQLLKENEEMFAETYGYPGFPSVLDDAARSEMLSPIIRNELDSFLGMPLDVIGTILNDYDQLDGAIRDKLKSFGIDERLDAVRAKFRDEKRRRGCIDFDDMMAYVTGLLKGSNELRENTRRRFSHVLVDEFQDTSPDNMELLRQVVPEESPRLFVVGDDWQSIYGFRNSRVEYIVRMKSFFPGVAIHRLGVNYRSRSEIVAVSGRFIQRNRFRTRKRIVSHTGKGGMVKAYRVAGTDEEAVLIMELIGQERAVTDDIAVLYRNNWQGRYMNKIFSDMSARPVADGVRFMTMHSSKGLEFHTVIVAGVADGILPDGLSDMEEERRLLYVAITRARERLHVICHDSNKDGMCRFGRELGLKFVAAGKKGSKSCRS